MTPVSAVALDASGHNMLHPANAVRISTLDPDHWPTANRHPLHEPSLRIVIVDGIVLGRPVVPHGNGVRSPVEPELVLGNKRLVKQGIEQQSALALIHVFDGEGELRIDKQYLATRAGMNAHHGMQLRRI